MGVVRGGGKEAWAGVFFGPQTRGRGRADMDAAPQTETLPAGEPAGAACPQCGAALRVLAGPRLQTRVPTRMVGCPACGFVELREVPPG